MGLNLDKPSFVVLYNIVSKRSGVTLESNLILEEMKRRAAWWRGQGERVLTSPYAEPPSESML